MSLLIGARRALLSQPQVRAIDSPLNIPGLWTWYDPSDASSVTIGTGVSQINDKSGNGLHLTQATGARQPGYSVTQNGLKVLSWAGATSMGRASVTYPSVGKITTFMVLNLTANGTEDVLLYHNASGPGVGFYSMLTAVQTYDTPPNGAAFYGAGQGYNTVPRCIIMPTAIRDGGYHILEAALSPSIAEMLIDGIPPVTSSSVTGSISGSTGQLILGNYTTGGGAHGWSGYIGEVLIYAAELSRRDRESVRKYLQFRWGTPR